MKLRIVLGFVLGVSVFPLSCGREDHDRHEYPLSKAEELAAIPVGLSVNHDPSPVRAVRRGRSGRRYSWIYATTVTAPNTDVTISEFGAFTWRYGVWVPYGGRSFNAEEFAEWYSCPNALLTKGSSATDPVNWMGNDELIGGKTKWYFIGTTSTGQRVKGVSVVEQIGELVE